MKNFFLLKRMLASLCCFILIISANKTVNAQCISNVQAYSGATITGNQAFSGALGMDFDVNTIIQINRLGAFDHLGDGIFGVIQVGIFDRTTGELVTGLSTSITGDADPLVAGHRMKSITPVILYPGNYSIVAVGFNNTDPNGNSGGSSLPTVTNNGGGAISFVGTARYDLDGSEFEYPLTLDGGPPSRYHAGTFEFSSPDLDGDGTCDADDNCINANPDQLDYDQDGVGDECDPDDDGDLTPDNLDCAPLDKNNSDYIMCHNGKTECVKAKDHQKKLNEKGEKWTDGPCTIESCKPGEIILCHDGKPECVKEKDKEKKLAEKGNHWTECGSASARLYVRDEVKDALDIAIWNANNKPKAFALSNFPNPFNASTKIKYEVPVAGKISIKVFTADGQEVATLFEGPRNPGFYTIDFNASRLGSGVYYCKMISANVLTVRIQKLVVAR